MKQRARCGIMHPNIVGPEREPRESTGRAKLSEGARSRANLDPVQLWRQWYDMTFGMWTNLLGSGQETPADPLVLYRRWLESLQETQKQAGGDSAGIANLYETWRWYTEATTESWRRAAEAGTRMLGLAVPRWAEMAEEFRKQMLEGGDLPADPMDF
ncbi:MAG TPA: hypothetical protein VE225_04855, partial [Rubrobacteraceae bacterium]|nr:hypothetical protein [Rubrobacteraceae bacterium]